MAFERIIQTRYDASTAGFDRGTRRVEQQLARLQRTTDTRLGQIDRRFERAGRAALRLGTALGLVGSGLGVNAVRRYAEAWRNAERQLTAAGFAIEGNRERLAQLAVRVRGDFQATSGAVARFARVTGDDLESSIRRVETLQKLLAVGGAAPSERRSAVLQLTQGLRAGQLGGEELRAIREAAPIEFLDALAARAGGTRAELKQLGADAKLTTEVIKGALDDLAQTADQQFAQLAVTGEEAFETLSTGFAVFFGRIDEQVGATAGVNQFLQDTGRFLSEDAEAAATFAKALEVAAVAAGVLAGGRGLTAVNRAIVEGAAARQAAVAATTAEVAASRQAVQQARERVVTLGQQFTATQRNARSVQQLERSRNRLTAANTRLTAAETRATAATNAHAIAQGRLSAATRLTTGAMNTLRATFTFFGGVPGLILAAVSAAVLLTDAFEDQADRLEDLRARLDEVGGTIDRLGGVERELERDTDSLTRANERLEDAIASQADAAADTARLEIDAIRRRIAKNQELKAVYEQIIRAQLGLAENDLAIERSEFFERFGRLSAEQVQQVILPPGGQAPSSIGEADARLNAARQRNIDARQAAIAAKQDAEQLLDSAEVDFLTTRGLISELEKTAAERRKLLEELNEPIEVDAESGSGGGAGGGGRAAATREQTDALQALIAAADVRAGQLIDEAVLLRATAEEAEFLAEKQRLTAEAFRLGLGDENGNLPNAVIDEIDSLAESYANVATALDNLRAAQEVIIDVTERNLTVQERINRERERLLELLPAIIELVGDEALAHEILSDAIEQATREIRENDPINELSEDIGRAISQADSFEDALDRVLEKLFELAAQDFFSQIFKTGGGQGGGFLSSLFSSVGSIFGAVTGGGGGGLNPVGGSSKFLAAGGVISQGRVTPFRSGGVVNRPTLFPLREGAGLMGEAGPEAILPLERGPDGSLGVKLFQPSEIVVPQDIGGGRGATSVTVEGSTIVLQGSNASPEELRRVLDERDRKLVDRIILMNDRDPSVMHT